MKATNSEISISSVIPFREFVFFDKPSIEIKSDYDFTNNFSQSYGVEDEKTRIHTSKTVSSINTLLAHQAEIAKLEHEIKKLQYEKSVLVKWIYFLY